MNAIIDAVADDFLGRLQLKPWWESLREYAYKGSIAVILLFTFYDKTKFNCLPVYTELIDYTDAHTVAVDAYCSGKSIPWYINRGNLIGFGMSIMTYILSNYWIHINGVNDRLTDLSKFGRSTLEMEMSAEEMMNACVLPVTSSSPEKLCVLRRNVQILLKYRNHYQLSRIYATRCLLVLVWTGICTVLAFWASVAEIRHDTTVTCQIDDSILLLGFGNATYTFACLDNATRSTAMLETIYAFTLLFQFQAMLAALLLQASKLRFKCRFKRQRRLSLRQEVVDVSDSRKFLIQMMGIDRRQAKKVKSFTKFILYGDELISKLEEYCDEAIISGDVEYFRIIKKKTTLKDFWRILEETATTVLQNGDYKAEGGDATDLDFKVHIFLDKVFRLAADPNSRFRPPTISEDVEYSKGEEISIAAISLPNTDDVIESEEIIFGENLLAKSNWHLLFCCPFAFENSDMLEMVNPDLLDSEGRSCLFYVLRKSSMDNLLSRFSLFDNLIRKLSKNNRKLVHFDGRSLNAEEFFYRNYPNMFRGKLPDFRLCEMQNTIEPTNECLDELEKIFHKYKYDKIEGREIRRHHDYEDEYTREQQSDISTELGRIKLARIDTKIATEFASKALDMRHWEVIVALINTFIVVEEQGKRPDNHGLIGQNVFNLQGSKWIKEIFEEALKRPRCKPYFVPTAAEHILSLMNPEERKKMASRIHRAVLPAQEKERLQQIAATT